MEENTKYVLDRFFRWADICHASQKKKQNQLQRCVKQLSLAQNAAFSRPWCPVDWYHGSFPYHLGTLGDLGMFLDQYLKVRWLADTKVGRLVKGPKIDQYVGDCVIYFFNYCIYLLLFRKAVFIESSGPSCWNFSLNLPKLCDERYLEYGGKVGKGQEFRAWVSEMLYILCILMLECARHSFQVCESLWFAQILRFWKHVFFFVVSSGHFN